MHKYCSVTPAELLEKLQGIKVSGMCRYTYEKCEQLTPIINKINQEKQERNAIILAHSYVSPEIVYGVADYVGDSYELSKIARDSNRPIEKIPQRERRTSENEAEKNGSQSFGVGPSRDETEERTGDDPKSAGSRAT